MTTAASRFPELSSGVLAFFFLAANLRPALTSVGPLLAVIRSKLGLSGAEAGLLTTLLLLIFAGCTSFARVANMFGEERTLAGCVMLIVLGIALRSQGSVRAVEGERADARWQADSGASQNQTDHAPNCDDEDLHIMAAGMCPRYHSSAARGSVTGQARGT
jgi:hypothetical protein